MKAFVKIGLLGLSLIVSGATLAQNTGSYTSGFFIGGDGLFLQPRNGDMDYVTLFPLAPSQTIHSNSINTDHQWGFDLFGGLRIGDHDDVKLGWKHLYTSDKDGVGNLGDSVSSTPRWGLSSTWNEVNGKVNYDLDAVYAELGHTMQINQPWQVRFAGGLEYADLNNTMTVTSFFSDEPNEVYGYSVKSGFRGIGPRASINMMYHFNSSFAVFADANLALLVAERTVDLDSLNLNDGKCPPASFEERDTLVPKIETKLGLRYSYNFAHEGTGNTRLNIDAGWEATTYIHGIERVGDSGVYGGVVSTRVSNYANQGAFFGASLDYDWC